MKPRFRAAWVVVREELLILASCLLRTEDRDEWRKYVHGVANPRIVDAQRTEQKGTMMMITAAYRTDEWR